MRRSIYNDYRPLRIVLLLLLVVLGLFIYIKCAKAPCDHVGNAWEVSKEATCTETGLRHKVCTECNTPFAHEEIPAIGHAPKASVNENEVASTCTVGGSHDVVVYCKNCDIELSRETVADELLPHKPGKVKQEDIVDPTHTVAGSYNDVVRCVECKNILESETVVLEPLGHEYKTWSNIEYNEELGGYAITGTCSCGYEHVVSDSKYFTATYDDRYAPCCINQYFVEFTYSYEFDGKTYTKKFSEYVQFDTEPHSIMVENVIDINGNPTVGFISIEKYASYDAAGIYYDLDNEAIKGYFEVDPASEWSVNGYNIGIYKCQACAYHDCQACCDHDSADAWFAVRVYSKEYDQTKA